MVQGVHIDELTPSERRVLALVADGYSNPGIADQLVVSLRTVESHLNRIFLKLGLRSPEGVHRRVTAALAWIDYCSVEDVADGERADDSSPREAISSLR